MDDVRTPVEPTAPKQGHQVRRLGGQYRKVDQAAGERWLAENREALKAWDAHIEQHGLPLARYRMR